MPISFLLAFAGILLVACGIYDGVTVDGAWGIGAWVFTVLVGPAVVLTALFWLWKLLRWVGQAIAEVNGGRVK
jgi:hypothetical protein